MATATDLSAVTETIKTLIDLILQENLETMITSTAAPPDASLNENKVSVYLYHVLESPEFKNLPPTTGSGPVPIQLAPMGLILQYIITVIHGSSETISNDSVIAEQRILGYVARAIHDFPVISASTRVPTPPLDATPILHSDLVAQKNTLRLNLRPATREETIAFWSSSDDKLPRLSLFLEVRVAILDPRQPLTLPGIVLRVGNFIFPGGPPQLTLTRNVLRFFPPASISNELQSITASPARPTLLPLSSDSIFSNAPPDPEPELHPDLIENSVITIEATDIRLGVRFLELKSGTFEVLIKMDGSENPDWAFEVSSSLVRFSMRRSVLPSTLDGVVSLAPVLLVPGVYTARVLVISDSFSNKPQSTNEIPFTAIPQIVDIFNVAPAANKQFQLFVAGGYLGTGANLVPESEILLAIRGVLLTPTITDPPEAGRFRIATPDRLDFHLPDEIDWPALSPTEPIILPVSLVIRGAPATPDWLESP